MTPENRDRLLKRDAIRLAYAETLRALRWRIGLAQERMALEARVDRAYVSGLERGLHTPSLETVLHFLPFLQVSFPEFAAEYEMRLRQVRRKLRNSM